MLEKQLGYTFKKDQLLLQALTHRSKHSKNYERLEFLGDSVLSLCISEHLFKTTQHQEGPLSVIRSDLISKANLNQIALSLDVDRLIRTANKQKISASIRADVIEAIIGAIYLDGGLEPATQFIRQHIINGADLSPSKDSKTKLQEWAHKHKHQLPKYLLTSIDGAAHDLEYTTQCELNGMQASATGKTKQASEQKAATKLYQQLVEEQA
jgi:ribonuclease-3